MKASEIEQFAGLALQGSLSIVIFTARDTYNVLILYYFLPCFVFYRMFRTYLPILQCKCGKSRIPTRTEAFSDRRLRNVLVTWFGQTVDSLRKEFGRCFIHLLFARFSFQLYVDRTHLSVLMSSTLQDWYKSCWLTLQSSFLLAFTIDGFFDLNLMCVFKFTLPMRFAVFAAATLGRLI